MMTPTPPTPRKIAIAALTVIGAGLVLIAMLYFLVPPEAMAP